MQVISLKDKVNVEEYNNITIEFANSLGVLYSNYLLIPQHNSRIPIELDSIKSIKLIKKDFVFVNFLSFLTGVVCISLIFLFSTTYLEVVLLSIVSLFFFIASFKLSLAKYLFIIAKQNLDFIELKIDKKDKEDAKKLIRTVEKLRKRKSNSIKNIV